VLVELAAAASWRAGLRLFPPVSIGAFEIAVGAVSLAIGLPFLSERFRGLLDPLAEERTRMMAPRTGRQLAAFYAVAVSAGFSEQLVYRGALFAILTAATGSWWVAAAVGAAAFGAAHLFQGGRAVGIVALIALRDQIVVGLTGTLVVAMVAHALHDMIAGTLLGVRARRAEGGGALAIP
jgi:membrane protease YdiL (CAAX protease family)